MGNGSLTLNEFQVRAMSTALPSAKNLVYMSLGLGNEAGEFQGKIKKKIRDGNFDEKAAMKELGDVLWYVAGCAQMLGFALEDVARVNLYKLADRAKRGEIGGSGDDR